MKGEFEVFVECVVLAHGVLGLRCADGGHDKLIAFSSKRRGFCPSCGAREFCDEGRAHDDLRRVCAPRGQPLELRCWPDASCS